jgi:hypothetical protein
LVVGAIDFDDGVVIEEEDIGDPAVEDGLLAEVDFGLAEGIGEGVFAGGAVFEEEFGHRLFVAVAGGEDGEVIGFRGFGGGKLGAALVDEAGAVVEDLWYFARRSFRHSSTLSGGRSIRNNLT